ncbi:MAG: hypothetical protein P4L96_17565, partial [Rhodoferax sp.]|nr:hypothetical protein [Rhodoferax sp.]
PCCSALNLIPVDPAVSGYRHVNTSTWGGNIIAAGAAGETHMWIAEMAPAGQPGDAGAGAAVLLPFCVCV